MTKKENRSALGLPKNAPFERAITITIISIIASTFSLNSNTVRAKNNGNVSVVPNGEVKEPRQARVSFSESMRVPEAEDQNPPVTLSCSPHKGTWLDDKTFAFTFSAPLSAGISCNYDWNKTFFTSRALPIPAPKSFDTGGPQIANTVPATYGPWSVEGYFAVKTTAPTNPESLKGKVNLRVDGIATEIPAELVQMSEAERNNFHNYFGWSKDLANQNRVFFFKAQHAMPEGTSIALIWKSGIKSLAGIATKSDQIFGFRTQESFQATLRCQRENEKSGCVPLTPIELNFNSEVSFKVAKAIRLVAIPKIANSAAIKALKSDPLLKSSFEPDLQEPSAPADKATVKSLDFKGPFAENSEWQVVFPPGFEDVDGRKLQSTIKSSFKISVGNAPLLAKFVGAYGIVEASDPVVPISVRSLDHDVMLQSLQLSPQEMEANPVAAFEWLHKVDSAKREMSIFAPQTTGLRERKLWDSVSNATTSSKEFQKKQLLQSKESLTLGLPLANEGLHILQLHSRSMANRLLDQKVFKDSSMYVSSAALVTDISLHAKVGSEKTLVWATRLSSGAPAENVKVTVLNCFGDKIGPVPTDSQGRVSFRTVDLQKACGYQAKPNKKTRIFNSATLLFFGTDGKNIGLLSENETQGLETWRFRSENLEGARPEIPSPYAMVLDRTLFKHGETMQVAFHSWGKISALPQCLVAEHSGTGQRKTARIKWGVEGVASVQLKWDENLKKGLYQIFAQKKCGSKEQSWGVFPIHFVRLEDFVLPTVQLTLQLPPQGTFLDARKQSGFAQVKFLSGGFAAGQPAQTHVQIDNLTSLQFSGFPGYLFSMPKVNLGLQKYNDNVSEGEYNSESEGGSADYSSGDHESAKGKENLAAGTVKSLTKLGSKGELNVVIPEIKTQSNDTTAVRIEAQLQFTEPGGVLKTVRTAENYSLTPVNIGLLADSKTDEQGKRKFSVAMATANGKPLEKQTVEVKVFPIQRYSVRKKIFGGVYVYETFQNIGASVFRCETQTTENGMGSCLWATSPGSFIVEATYYESKKRISSASTEIWEPGLSARKNVEAESDRLELKLDKKKYAIGETARLEVVSHWEKSTALVTLEASNVLKSYVVELRKESPFIEFPITADLLPNASVGVIIVRGRPNQKENPANKIVGEVDLGKPSFRFGLTHFRVDTEASRIHINLTTGKNSYKVRSAAELRIKLSDSAKNPVPPDTRLTVFAIDKAMLQLADNSSTDIFSQLLPFRSLEVSTATSMLNVIGKRHFGLKARPPGGGGGRMPPRENFDALLFWKSNLKPNADGALTVPFEIKDSLTEYRIFAVATSNSKKLLGTQELDFSTRQDVLTIASLPKLVRANDSWRAEFVLRNSTNAPMNVDVTLKSDPSLKSDPKAIESLELSKSSVRLEPGVSESVFSKINANNFSRALVFEIKRDGIVEDRVKQVVSVQKKAEPRALSASVFLMNEKPLARTFALPQGGVVQYENLLPGPGPRGFFEDYLKNYPHSCSEQLLSIAVPSNVKSAWPNFIKILEARTDSQGLVKYFSSESMKGDVWLTAYVLVVAESWKKTIPEDLLHKYINALKSELAENRSQTSPLVLEALARHAQAFNLPSNLRDADFAKMDWESFLSLGAAFYKDTKNVFSQAHREKWTAAFKNRQVRSGAITDLAVLNSTSPLQAQWARARTLELLTIPPLQSEFSTFRAELEAAHTRGLSELKNPSTFWSVWALLAIRHSNELRKSQASPDSAVQINFQNKSVTLGSGKKFENAVLATEVPVAVSVVRQPLKSIQANVSGPLLFESVRTFAPLTQAEHRGIRIDCTAFPKELALGQVFDFETKLIPSAALSGWTVLEVPLFPGLQVMSFESGLSHSFGSNQVEFIEKSELSWKLWYLNIGSQTQVTKWTVRAGVPGNFQVPGCQGESIPNPDVSSASASQWVKVQ